ncbi:1-acyl-sn-glycerol-3-phosphate acyltransferase [Thalassobaculum fulvum]|uniref:1-acyl-sn-glycerol-3-phosphate acyltransferase n=1 Tax=Thalassobaculum fulvum TaxID=1633335 RepID=A0A919CPH0_9PROT|nr:lysophospholipid acyltransferase family protein [Thalassobaculum fulvum]GHD50380.1 1-acyl-sn-glycerol-3-phosphate acyltransferase [Thalassobaculum fulvum]
MILVRSLLFNILFYAFTLLVGVFGLPSFLFGRRAVQKVSRFWSGTLVAMARVVAGIDVELRGTEYLPKGAAIVAAKHQSAWETLYFTELLDRPAAVMKQELVRVPIVGPYMRAMEMIPVDRKAGAKALRQMVEDARAAAATGRAILIFPQGTRVAPGTKAPYHPGTAALYVGLGLPVVPVALNSGMYWSRNAFWKRPGRIVVEFLPPIPPGLDRKAFMARLEETLETATDRLEAEARGE